jgi:hypothetical protein
MEYTLLEILHHIVWFGLLVEMHIELMDFCCCFVSTFSDLPIVLGIDFKKIKTSSKTVTENSSLHP